MRALIEMLRDRNIQVKLKGEDGIEVIFPGEALPEDILVQLRNHKPALVDYLRKSEEENNYSEIQAAPPRECYPLSASQYRIWVSSQFEGGSKAYNSSTVYQLEGALDVQAFEKSFWRLLSRHEILRTVFRMDGNNMVSQYILPATAFDHAFGFCTHSGEDNRKWGERMVEEIVSMTFDLEKGPLITSRLIGLDSHTFIFAVNIHHIIADGWSKGLLFNELMQLYVHQVNGGPDPLKPLRIQYKDYALWEQQQVNSEKYRAAATYWLNHFSGEIPVLNLATDYPRPAVKTYHGSKLYVEINGEPANRLKQMAHRLGGTLFMGLLALVKALLYRYTLQLEIVIGSPVSGRNHVDVEGQLGCYINTIALKTRIAGHESFEQLFLKVKKATIEAYNYQYYPFDDLVKQIGVKRDKSRSLLFDVLIVLHNTDLFSKREGVTIEGCSIKRRDDDNHTSKFDISFEFSEKDGGLGMVLEFNTDLFTTERMTRMGSHLQTLLAAVVSRPSVPITEAAMLSAAEEQQLTTGFNQTAATYPTDKTIIDLFREQVLKHPQATAVVFEQQSLTYAALDARSNQLGHYLRGKGVKAESLVAVCLERGVDLMVAILGILKAGGAYVPVDPAYPDERIAYMLEDSAAALVVSSGGLGGRLGALTNVAVVELDHHREQIGRCAEAPPLTSLRPGNLVYVMYTSGSTGKPKGVMIEHGSLVNQLCWCRQAFGLTAGDAVLQKTNYCFDVSVWELLWPLLNGASVILSKPGGQLDNDYLKSLIESHQVTVVNFVPSLLEVFLHSLAENECRSLRIVMCAGEAMSIHLAALFTTRLAHATLYNLYGPTETSVAVTYWPLPKAVENITSVPIGKPVANTQVYILDGFNHLCPVGNPGELHIAGIQLARGYLHQPELTAARFVNLPAGGNAILRLYKTGDAGCWLPDGNIAFLGRLDDQVKIRGYRIEPAEIEHALLQSNMVSAAVVVCRSAASEGSQQLVAYVVAAEGFHKDALLAYLQRSLPHYMVPSLVVQLERIPLTPNGKTDRKALPHPEGAGLAGQGYVAPRNDTEQQLAALWQQLLGIERIGIHDNFFELGGHSLLAMKAVAAMRRQPATAALSMRHIFEEPTIARLAVVAAGHGPARAVAPITGGGRPARVPLSFGQERLWFIDQLEGSVHYHLPFVLRLQGAVDARALEEAFQQVIRRQEVLRSVVREGETGVFQQLLEAEGWQLEVIDAQGGGKGVVEGWISELVSRPFNLGQDYMLRAQLLLAAGSERVLVVTMHHIASDGWSVPIVVKELLEAYVAAARGTLPGWKALPVQYSDYALWQRSYLQGEVLEGQLSYWKKQLEGVLALELPTDYVRPKVMDSRGGRVYFELEEPLRQGLEGLSGSHGATLYMTLLSAFKVLLYRYSGQEDICVGSASANRMQWEVQGVVGCFVNTLALRSRVEGKMGFEELLRQVRQTTVGAYAHQEVPFEKVVDAVVKQRQADRSPLFQVMFDLQQSDQQHDFSNSLPGVEIFHEVPGISFSRFDLAFTFIRDADGIRAKIEYRQDLFKHDTISRMFMNFKHLLYTIAEAPNSKIGAIRFPGHEEHTRPGADSIGFMMPEDELFDFALDL